MHMYHFHDILSSLLVVTLLDLLAVCPYFDPDLRTRRFPLHPVNQPSLLLLTPNDDRQPIPFQSLILPHPNEVLPERTTEVNPSKVVDDFFFPRVADEKMGASAREGDEGEEIAVY